MNWPRSLALVGFALLLTASPGRGQDRVDYVVNIQSLTYMEQIRPLLTDCKDIGTLSLIRDEIQNSDNLESYRSILAPVGLEVFSNCPSGYSAPGITRADNLQNSGPALFLNLGTYGGGSRSGYSGAIRQEIEGYDFSLDDVEDDCEVYRYSEDYGELECGGVDVDEIEDECNVYFYDEDQGEISCDGYDLRPVERSCTVYMYSEDYGEVNC